MQDTFHIDTANSDNERMYVDIKGCASVCIIVTDEGVIVDLYPAHITDGPTATMGATWAEIAETN